MSTDDRSAAEIERQIEEERHALARSLEDLQAQFSPDRLMNEATTYMRRNGGEFADNIVRQVRDNPIAATMAGVGIAWLLYGSSRPASARTYDRTKFTHDPRFGDGTYREPARPAVGYDDRSYASAPGGLGTPTHRAADFDRRLSAADGDDDGPSTWDRLSDKAGEMADDAKSAMHAAGQSASDTWDRTTDDASRALDDAGARMRSGYDDGRDATSRAWRDWQGSAERGYGQARAGAARAKGRLYAKSSDLWTRMSEGTEGMSESARTRVMRARQAAYDAQRDMEDRFGEYAASGRRMYDDQPLVGGLIAAVIGAAVGAALPRTETEDEYLGAYRDRAFDEAERVFRDEATKLKAVAEAAMDEAKSVADEKVESAKSALDGAKDKAPTGKDAVDKVESEARSAAERVADAAKEEARKQNLGGSLN